MRTLRRKLLAPAVAGMALMLLVALAGCATNESASPAPVAAQAEDEGAAERTLSVSGSGAVEATPDQAVVTVGVQTEDEEAGPAMSENAEQMQAVVEALQALEIAEEDIQTQRVRLDPFYEQGEPRTGGAQELAGFRATNLVRVTLRDVEMVGEALDAAVQAGANRVEGIEFVVSDPAEALTEAREAAWENAEAKAEQLAELAGVTLGPVLTLNESTQGPVPVARGFAVEEAAAVPVQPGTETVRVDLQVTWTLQ